MRRGGPVKCVIQTGPYFREKQKEEEQVEEVEKENKDRIEKTTENFFEKGSDSVSVELFIGTTLKKPSMESYKSLYINKGEHVLLENAPERFLILWGKEKEKIKRYFDSI